MVPLIWRTLQQDGKPRDRLRNSPRPFPAHVLVGVLIVAGVQILPVADREDKEAVAS